MDHLLTLVPHSCLLCKYLFWYNYIVGHSVTAFWPPRKCFVNKRWVIWADSAGEGGIRQKTTELEMNAFLLVPLLRTRYPHACFVSFLPQVKHQSSVNTFLPGLEMAGLNIAPFWGRFSKLRWNVFTQLCMYVSGLSSNISPWLSCFSYEFRLILKLDFSHLVVLWSNCIQRADKASDKDSITGTHGLDFNTLETAYKVAICHRVNLLYRYMRIYLINDQNLL